MGQRDGQLCLGVLPSPSVIVYQLEIKHPGVRQVEVRQAATRLEAMNLSIALAYQHCEVKITEVENT